MAAKNRTAGRSMRPKGRLHKVGDEPVEVEEDGVEREEDGKEEGTHRRSGATLLLPGSRHQQPQGVVQQMPHNCISYANGRTGVL